MLLLSILMMQEPTRRESPGILSGTHSGGKPEVSPELPRVQELSGDQELPEGQYIVERLVAKRQKVPSLLI